jgi:hypothetical protein
VNLWSACLLPAILLGQTPEAQKPVKAMYDWGYAGSDGTGKGSLAILVDPSQNKVIIELHGLGERLMLLEGDGANGYRLQIPRKEMDTRSASLSALPLPFLPQIGSPLALFMLLTEGTGPGVKVTQRDKDGPKKIRYTGLDDNGKEVMVWLSRTKWER